MVWTKAKINYVFVFEFDTRHALDWRQLAEVSITWILYGQLCANVGSVTLLIFYIAGHIDVAQLHLGQRYVHILAGCADPRNAYSSLLAGSDFLSPHSEMVGIL